MALRNEIINKDYDCWSDGRRQPMRFRLILREQCSYHLPLFLIIQIPLAPQRHCRGDRCGLPRGTFDAPTANGALPTTNKEEEEKDCEDVEEEGTVVDEEDEDDDDDNDVVDGIKSTIDGALQLMLLEADDDIGIQFLTICLSYKRMRRKGMMAARM